MKTTVPFVRMHEVIAARLPHLSPLSRPDVAFAKSLPDFKHSVPGKHRSELIGIVTKTLDGRSWKTSRTARKMAADLRSFRWGMEHTTDGDGKTVSDRTSANNGASTHTVQNEGGMPGGTQVQFESGAAAASAG